MNINDIYIYIIYRNDIILIVHNMKYNAIYHKRINYLQLGEI